MRVIDTELPDVKILEPRIHGDHRGYFIECWNRRTFERLGLDMDFVQDNQSSSTRCVLRGLHYQIRHAQGKLVRVVRGEVFDVAVDLRRGSTTCGRWAAARLSAGNRHQLWVPPGFGHGFYVLSEEAELIYKCTDYYSPEDERAVCWDDPELGIEWPLAEGGRPVLSAKDEAGTRFRNAELYDW